MEAITTAVPNPNVLWHDVSDKLTDLYEQTGVAKAVAGIFEQPTLQYTPKAGDTVEDIARVLGVMTSNLKINLFTIPVGVEMRFDGKYVSIVRPGKVTTFPVRAAENDSQIAIAA